MNKQVINLVGGLSKTSKMPGSSYGLPAAECVTGSKLAKIPGTVCSKCYALKGFYRMKNVQDAQYRRLATITEPWWVDEMVKAIAKSRDTWFRWHDSGDVQSFEHLEKIAEVAARMPDVRFWLPTRELAFVKRYTKENGDFPANLCVRISSASIDQPPISGYAQTSTVVSEREDATCPATLSDDHRCLDCRACWDRSQPNVAYLAH